MNGNIASEYIMFSQNAIKKYLTLILGHHFDQDIYDDLINAYINTRYYNLYPKKFERLEENIVYYLKVSIQDIKDDIKFKDKAKYMFQMFKYILYFDGVVECDSVRKLISEIKKYRIIELKLPGSDFEVKLYNLLQNDLISKQQFLDSFDDKNFTVNYVKIKEHIFDCILEHNLKFSKIYSDYAIKKVFNSKAINEQKSFVSYPLVCVKALKDVIKGNYTKKYLIDYVFTIANKERKNKKLLNYIDNDIIKEKIVLKIDYDSYLADKEKVYELTKRGFKVSLKIKKDFKFDEDSIKLLKLFSYLIVDDDKFYEQIKDKYDVLFIPNS